MNMQTLDMEVFFRSLTEEQMDICESDEKKLREIFEEGWSEATAVRFHRAMLTTRRFDPGTTVEGVMEVALWVGLAFLSDEEVCARLKQRRDDDIVVFGIARPDGKDIVRSTSAMPAKLRKRPSVRGVRGV